MAKHGKKYVESKKLIDSSKNYSVSEAVELLKKTSTSKFDGTVEIAIKTLANPRFNDQMIRSTVTLPNGTGKSKKVAIFAGADKVEEAKKLGADIVGSTELLDVIKSGKIEFDVLITTPDNMRNLASVAKVLGPKGLMPSPKAGTVTQNLAETVSEIKKGKMEFRVDKTGNIHSLIGKVSFDNSKLEENLKYFVKTVLDNKPAGVKGKLIKKVVVSSTMGPGISVELSE